MQTSNMTKTLILISTETPKRVALSPYYEEFFMTITVLSPLWVAIISFGLIANITNIVVFLKTGAKDNVTILLLSLAVSDLMFLTLITATMCRFLIWALVRSHSWPYDPNLFSYLLYWPAFAAYDLSTFISVSLGVMRCACVAMPLKFKFVFTKSRTIKWVVFLAILAVSLRIPVLTIHRIAWKIDPSTNVSVPFMTYVNRVSMSRINDIMNRGFVIYFNYITMVICVIVLTVKLYQAAKIRRSCTAKVPQSSDLSLTKPDDEGLSSKDLQVVKSVVLVCSIFISSQLSFLVTSTVRLLAPEFDAFARLRLLFGILSQINLTCSYLNASLNIFVYYNYNSRFRSVFLSLLSFKGKQ
ncbi:chemosensory receptor A [Elysia marginata]|uniref:Chemosensory receptor A n=1 Tax=Elysia marginata TaxID=1093978 RepID=A0AAV4IXC1_9GAST|nr:chemosensory receptor A [Elysia marginata]